MQTNYFSEELGEPDLLDLLDSAGNSMKVSEEVLTEVFSRFDHEIKMKQLDKMKDSFASNSTVEFTLNAVFMQLFKQDGTKTA